MLLGADRINMVEGLAEDLAHGHVPNLPGELGLGAHWRHDRDGMMRKLGIGASVAVVAVALLGKRKDRLALLTRIVPDRNQPAGTCSAIFLPYEGFLNSGLVGSV